MTSFWRQNSSGICLSAFPSITHDYTQFRGGKPLLIYPASAQRPDEDEVARNEPGTADMPSNNTWDRTRKYKSSAGYSPSCEANSRSASHEITTFYGTQMSITMFTKARLWSLFTARRISPHLPTLIS